MHTYPDSHGDRDRFVHDRRGPRPLHNPWAYQNLIVEDERTGDGRIARVATVFLTGRECPWRCVMCDLWQFTTPEDTPKGAIAAQVAAARRALAAQPQVATMKLYNAGSFFDPRAVPESDYGEIASRLAGFERVIVESHPSLIGPRADRFLEALASTPAAPQLEVAIGLETAHPQALERLNKRMTVADFSRAAAALAHRGVALRVFLLIAPPFVPPDEHDVWLRRSLDVALSCGATVTSLVPTRPGNGAVEALTAQGCFRAPTLEDIERSFESALDEAAGRGRVFVDLWDLERFVECRWCEAARRARLEAMNLGQRRLPRVRCDRCGSGVSA
jgi:radical SAM enzyme (TIGR01210 family)